MRPPVLLLGLRAPPTYICNNGLHSCTIGPSSPRPFSASTSRAQNPQSPPSAAYSHLLSRRLISLSGPDSTRFLQGVTTANLSPQTARSSGFYAAFLNAQGRILNDVFIYPDMTRGGGRPGDGWLIEVDAKEAEKLAKHIQRHKLRAKFDVRLLGLDESGVWSLWKDEDGGWTPHGLAGDQPPTIKEGQIGCEDKRAPGMGRRLILPTGKKPEEDVEESTEDVYRVRRYLKGVAEGQDELIREASLPQESNVDFMGGIDYKKGCYVGQELTIRIHHTGVVRKRILPVMLYGKSEPIPTALEYSPEKNLGVEGISRETSIGRFEKKGRSAGKWLAGVGNIGLALCRLEIMTDMQLQGEGGGYKEGDEFKLEWEVDDGCTALVKVKAFLPPWHLRHNR